MIGTGFIGIWSDVAPEDETDYLHWLTREHTGERVGTAGFLGVRVFRALHVGVNRFFILYELRDADVVGSPAYLARLNDPTPWSRRIMPKLGHFVRGGGRLVASAGTGQGGFASAIPLAEPLPNGFETWTHSLAREDRIASVRVYETDDARTSIATSEKNLRADDRSFKSLVLIEALDEASLVAALGKFRDLAPGVVSGSSEPHVYAGVFGLDRRTILHAAD